MVKTLLKDSCICICFLLIEPTGKAFDIIKLKRDYEKCFHFGVLKKESFLEGLTHDHCNCRCELHGQLFASCFCFVEHIANNNFAFFESAAFYAEEPLSCSRMHVIS